MARKDGNQQLLGEFGRLAILVLLALLLYTIAVASLDPPGFFGWLNTLVSTGVSVFFALLVGLLLFNHQTRETSRTRKSELSRLLRTELSEVKRVIEQSKTNVPDEAMKIDAKEATVHEMGVSLYYAHPLIVEEAVRSGQFDEAETAEMLALARNMRVHSVLVQEYMTMSRHLEGLVATSRRGYAARAALEGYGRRAEIGRSVQRSEERVVEGCERLLERLEDKGS